ncbi:MAG: rod-binding protein [Planctomycetota bacterium]
MIDALNINPTAADPLGAMRLQLADDNSESCDGVLDRHLPGQRRDLLDDASAPAGTDNELYEASQQLVASAFIAPLLQQVRDSAREGNMFYGGSTEDLFGHQLDQQLADRIVQSSRFPIVDAVYRQIGGGRVTGGEVDRHG